MKLAITLAISAAILTAQSSRPLRSVTAIRHWSLSDVTRIAIEVSGDFEFRTDHLLGPERVYFDILGSRPLIDSRRYYSEEIQDKLVNRIRVAENVQGVTRIVIHLNGPVEASVTQLTNPYRLIVELRPGRAPAIPVTEPPDTRTITLPPAPAPTASLPPATMPPAPLQPPAPVAVARPEPPLSKPAPRLPEEIAAVVRAAPAPESRKAETLVAETSKAARHTTSGGTSLVRALGLKIGRVVIDPGHGGHDQGTEGPKGLLEKDVVLDIAMRLGKLIEDRLGAEVIYTRTDDTFIPLEGRTALANDKKADLFLSIHANSSSVKAIAGVETYYLNFSDSQDALDVASRENATSQKSVFELRDLVQSITVRDKAEESKEFAGRVQAALYAFSARNIPTTKNRGVKRAPFVVLIGARMPSVLAEIGFLSNPREESLLRKPDYREKLADALFRGVSKYAESLSHFQVAKAGNE